MVFHSYSFSSSCGVIEIVATNSFFFMIAQDGGNVNRGGADRGVGAEKYRYRGAVSVVLLHLVNIKLTVCFKAVGAQPST